MVTLDSDSDEEVAPHCAAKSSVKVEKLSQPSTRGCWTEKVISPDVEGKVGSKLSGAVDKPRDSVSLEALPEKVICSDDEIKAGPQLPGLLEKPRDSVSQGGLLGRAITVDDESLAVKDGKKFSSKAVQFAETTPAGCLLEKSIHLELDGLVGSISGRTHGLAVDKAALVQSRDLPPRWDDGFAVAAASTSVTVPAVVDNVSGARQNIASSTDDVPRTACVSRKRPSPSIEGMNQSDLEQWPSRKCMRPEDGLVRDEEKTRSSRVQPIFQDLTGSDDEIPPNSKLELSGKLEIAREPVPLGGIVRMHPSIEIQGTVGPISNAADLDIALKAATAYVAERSTWWDDDDSADAGPSAALNSPVVKPNRAMEGNVDERDYLQISSGSGELPNSAAAEGPKSLSPAEAKVRSYFRKANVCGSEDNGPSPPVRPAFQDLTSDDDGCAAEPEWLRKVPHNYRDEECSPQLLPNLGGNSECRKSVEPVVPSSPKLLDPAQGEVRNAFRAGSVGVLEEGRRIAPVRPVVQDLTSDDDGYGSEPEWLQRAHESLSQRGRLDSPVRQDFSGPGLRDQYLPASLQIPSRESQENRGIAVHTSAIDLESDDGLTVVDKSKRKKRGRPIGAVAERRALDDASNVPSNRTLSRATKGLPSEEQVSARAQKQREREEEKRAKEEKKEVRYHLHTEFVRFRNVKVADVSTGPLHGVWEPDDSYLLSVGVS